MTLTASCSVNFPRSQILWNNSPPDAKLRWERGKERERGWAFGEGRDVVFKELFSNSTRKLGKIYHEIRTNHEASLKSHTNPNQASNKVLHSKKSQKKTKNISNFETTFMRKTSKREKGLLPVPMLAWSKPIKTLISSCTNCSCPFKFLQFPKDNKRDVEVWAPSSRFQ